MKVVTHGAALLGKRDHIVVLQVGEDTKAIFAFGALVFALGFEHLDHAGANHGAGNTEITTCFGFDKS